MEVNTTKEDESVDPSSFSGVTEIRTREPLLATTRFPGVPLFTLPVCNSDFNNSLLCELRVYCATYNFMLSVGLLSYLHICSAKIYIFNHICKSFTASIIESKSESSSTIESNWRSSKCGHDSTPNCSARRYTRLNSRPLSCVVAGTESGITVNSLHPQPGHSSVSLHQAEPFRRRQQSFTFENIPYPPYK